MTVTIDVGEPLPPLTNHAISVSLPTWRSNVGYEEGEEWVLSKMKTGYPRFYIHNSITKLAKKIVKEYGSAEDDALLLPTRASATRCVDFFKTQGEPMDNVRILDFVPNPKKGSLSPDSNLVPLRISAVVFPQSSFPTAKAFWQHSGEGVSSRRAEWCHEALTDGFLVEQSEADLAGRLRKGPKRYRKESIGDDKSEAKAVNGLEIPGTNGSVLGQDSSRFVEERFGRNLDLAFAEAAKTAVRRRIAGTLTADVELSEALALERDEQRQRQVPGFSEDDVYLYPGGMNAIFTTHRLLMKARGEFKSISYGFPYIDTLKILQKFGPGCVFYGRDDEESLQDLERRLATGERFLALFCEFPGNPLLRCPDLQRIRGLADKYGFLVVVDETIGNFINVNVLPYADVVVSSLTKVFSGDSNVMGGSAILNPKSQVYPALKRIWDQEYEDTVWPEDAIYLERNSRDFVSRIDRINENAEAICEVLLNSPHVKQVNYPKHNATKPFYEQCRNPTGGYGGLLSATLVTRDAAIAFFDNLDTAKGPSLGTNFTLSSPYVILAHYGELEWAASFGVEADLIRVSVGLEDRDDLIQRFQRALAAIPGAGS